MVVARLRSILRPAGNIGCLGPFLLSIWEASDRQSCKRPFGQRLAPPFRAGTASPVTVLQHDSQPFTAPRGLPEPVKQIPATDKERLDLALYETFDAIAKLAMPPYNDARYLTENWETKLIDASARRELFAEILAIRAKYVKFAQRMHHIVFNDYYYYIDELRDGVLREVALIQKLLVSTRISFRQLFKQCQSLRLNSIQFD